jgi:formylglycine-generating enzyme required for sulfatase activity
MIRLLIMVSMVMTSARGIKTAGEVAEAQDGACVAATGETIPHPCSMATYTIKDGEQSIEVPAATVYVPAGKFTMGERQSAHEVYLDAFCIGKYEVTNAEWKMFLDDTGSRARPRYWRDGKIPPGKENHPLLFVSWNDARKYCAWVSKKTGWSVSLPTEAQWEKAARGGSKEYLFPWGNDRETKNCNYSGYCASRYGLPIDQNGEVSGWRQFTKTDPYREIMATGGYTTPVGTFPAGKSAYGAYDMAGNAFEWCLDWYKEDYYKLADAGTNPKGPSEQEAEEVHKAQERGKNKVIRGGSWYAHFSSCLTTSRREVRDPTSGYHSVGFRVVATVPRTP